MSVFRRFFFELDSVMALCRRPGGPKSVGFHATFLRDLRIAFGKCRRKAAHAE